MSFVQSLTRDLIDKRLWPIAVLLIIAAIALPVAAKVTSSSSPPRPVVVQNQAPPPPAGLPAPAQALQAVAGPGTPTATHYTGPERDPFRTAIGTPKPLSSSAPASHAAAKSGGTSQTTSTTSKGTTSTPTSTTAPKTVTPVAPVIPTPVPEGLAPTQAYRATFALTTAAGGVNTVDSLMRLTVLPSTLQPLLVYLGVLNGGHRALFLVQPGTVVSGPGVCTPGPTDCEILSLAREEIAGLAVRNADVTVPVGLFAVTAITAADHSSAAAADRVRRKVSSAGRDLVRASTFGALQLFRYAPSLGALVDLRNLAVAGTTGTP